jgi:hypothetical protein
MNSDETQEVYDFAVFTINNAQTSICAKNEILKVFRGWDANLYTQTWSRICFKKSISA